MSGAVEGAIGANESAGSDGDEACVEKSAVEIHIDAFSEPKKHEHRCIPTLG